MRALFITWAWDSHLQPMVPFAWALRAAGHEVLVASHPSFAKTITAAGLAALPVGEDLDVRGLMREAHRQFSPDESAIRHSGERANAVAIQSTNAMAKDTFCFAQHWRPDVVVYEPMAYLGPWLAAELDVPALRLLWAADYMASIADKLEAKGLGTRQELFGKQAFGDVTLDPCPPRLRTRDELVRRPMRYVAYNGPAVMPQWLTDPPARPRIVVTWGRSHHYLGWDDAFRAPAVVRALAGRDVEVVVAVLDEQRERFGELPGNVVHLGPVALNLVTRDCAGIIHQGGAGATMTAVSAGVPQLIIGSAADAIVNARLVEAAGAGRYEPPDLDDAGLTRVVNSFLDDLPDLQAGAAELHREHRAMPSPVEVAAQLEPD
ncbi:MAG: DUF1205 domain-containing protein, partial [Micromonosporaceae bacterium]|nr:DUF1205 domain-containing protein [Micromonosporaceae bacterium]